jgi:glycolate oxidase
MEFLPLQEIVAAARRNLPPGPWAYLVGGAETETTVRRNRQALDSIAFRPRVLRNVSRIDSTAAILGRASRLPLFLAPIGGLEALAEGGAAPAARAAAQFGIPLMLSSVCQPGLEQTAAAAADGTRIFQLYVRGDDAWVDDYVRRAREHGYAAFCLTVDVAMYSRRERDLIGRLRSEPLPGRALLGTGEAAPGQVPDAAAHHQGHRHRRGRRARSRARRRGYLCLEPWRAAARPRPG